MKRHMKQWYRLDNAATIVPATTRGSDTRVFRLVCELEETVDPETLQEALDEAVHEYPHLNVVLRRGLFWYYLDGTDRRPIVEEDHRPACGPLYYPGRRNLLYRVTYYGKRINLEMFHVLADGTGGFAFLKKIVSGYLKIKHQLVMPVTDEDRSSVEEKHSDAFRHFYRKDKGSGQLGSMVKTRAFQIPFDRDDDMTGHLLEGVVSAGSFIELARSFHTTAGILSTAIYIEAVLKIMSVRDQKKPVMISVPVNLRQYFPSATARNFFGVITVTFYAGQYDGTLDSIIAHVKEAFASQLEEDSVRATMNSYSALTGNIAIKMVPLVFKDPVIAMFAARTRAGTTATLSNLGRITVPEEMAPYIRQFSAFMSNSNMQVTISTFKDRMVFGVVSGRLEHGVMLNFFRGLTSRGISVELTSNDYDVEEGS